MNLLPKIAPASDNDQCQVLCKVAAGAFLLLLALPFLSPSNPTSGKSVTRDERGSSPFVKSPNPKATSETFSDSECQLPTAPSSTPALGPSAPRPHLLESKALPLEWLLAPKDPASLTDRILARLIQQEAHEVNPHVRDDLRIAWLLVLHCMRGDAVECTPHVLATQEVLGLHPDKVYPSILARRKALLGREENHVPTTHTRNVGQRHNDAADSLEEAGKFAVGRIARITANHAEDLAGGNSGQIDGELLPGTQRDSPVGRDQLAAPKKPSGSIGRTSKEEIS